MYNQYTTRIERIPGERPHSVECDAYVDGAVIGTFATHAAAQEALDEHIFDRLRRQPPALPTEPISGEALAALWSSDREAALRFLAELSASDLLVQAVLHSQWLLQARGRAIEPIEIVRRYHDLTAACLTPASLQQAA